MYFWKINKLKQLLIEKGLSENNAFKYTLWCIGLSAACIEMISYFPLELTNNWDYINSTLAVLIPVVGTIFAYKSNGGDKGKDFLARYISVSFVILIRFILYLVPIMFMLVFYYISAFDEEAKIYTTLFEVVLFSTWYIALYYSIVKHINDVAKA